MSLAANTPKGETDNERGWNCYTGTQTSNPSHADISVKYFFLSFFNLQRGTFKKGTENFVLNPVTRETSRFKRSAGDNTIDLGNMTSSVSEGNNEIPKNRLDDAICKFRISWNVNIWDLMLNAKIPLVKAEILRFKTYLSKLHFVGYNWVYWLVV